MELAERQKELYRSLEDRAQFKQYLRASDILYKLFRLAKLVASLREKARWQSALQEKYGNTETVNLKKLEGLY